MTIEPGKGRRRSRGRIFKRPGTPFFYIAYSVNGKEIKKTTRSTDRAVAEKKLDAIIHPRLRLAGLEPATVVDILDDYIRDIRLRKIRSPKNVILSSRRIVLHLDDPHMPASELRHRHIRELQERLVRKMAPATVNQTLGIFKTALRLAVQNEYIEAVPAFPKRLRASAPRQGFLKQDEFERVRSELPPWAQDVFEFAYFTGWRRGEIFGLTWSEVDLEGKTIRLHPERSKNSHGRLCPISSELEPVMRRRLAERRPGLELVFHKKGRPIESAKWHRAWKPARERAGMPKLLLHDMRRTAARNFIRAGIPADVAMRLTGHRSQAMLTRYNIVSEDDLFDAAEKLHAYLEAQPKEAPKKGTVLAFEAKGEK